MPEPRHSEEVALVELVNRVVDRGVVLTGELTISVADVDLLYLGIRLLLCSPDNAGIFAPSNAGLHPRAAAGGTA